jgi:hypothetical protein
MESRQAILPDALRVNANLFQTDLCRDPEHRDVFIQITVYPINQGKTQVRDRLCTCVYGGLPSL